MSKANYAFFYALGVLFGLCVHSGASAAEDAAADPHYTPAGFFDVHVCTWPDRPRFLMALWSTTRFAEVREVAVFLPNGRRVGSLDLNRYHIVPRREGKPEKRVFITHFDIPAGATDGWYAAEATFTGGEQYRARDFVMHQTLSLPENLIPQSDVAEIPVALSWDAVPGAAYYKVFVKDLWADGAVIYTSGMLKEPRVLLPPGLLQRGGSYTWRVHARDVNEHPRLGDFNHGSLSQEVAFSIKP